MKPQTGTWQRPALAICVLALGASAACAQRPETPAAIPAVPTGVGELIYSRGAPETRELVVLDAATQQVRALAAAPGAEHAVWSADGTRIAFRAPHDGHLALGTLAADGADLRWLAPNLVVNDICWSPDGRWLVFDALDAAPAEPADYVTGEPAGTGPGGARSTVYRVSADGSAAPEKLEDGHSPQLSADGAYVIVQRSKDAEELHVLHLPSGSFKPLMSAVEFAGRSFTARGDRLYIGRKHGAGIWQIVGTPWPELRWSLVAGGGKDTLPQPSPDGRTLALVRRTASDERRGEQLFTLDVATRAERHWPLEPGRQVTDLEGAPAQPEPASVPAPPQATDGDARAAGAGADTAIDADAAIHELAWSPDGRQLALIVGGVGPDAPRRLLLLDMGSGATVTLLEASGAMPAGLAWRPSPVAAREGLVPRNDEASRDAAPSPR